MKVGDLVDFEFEFEEDVYTGLILATPTEPVPHVKVLFFDTVVGYSMEELDTCNWEVISAGTQALENKPLRRKAEKEGAG